MARLILLLLLQIYSVAADGAIQASADRARVDAGECARCHVISVVEWSCSEHWKAGTDCIACHGPSRGHVIDERNNVKPDKFPRRGAIAALCIECHEDACPTSSKAESCQTCHHVHALVDPQKPPSLRDERLELLEARWERYSKFMQEGERLVKASQWEASQAAFQAALGEKPRDPTATARLELCQRRLQPGLAGFEKGEAALDEGTGLPSRVRISGLHIPMILVAGGEFELGSDQLPNANPPHQVRVGLFYLAQHELTQSEWQAIMGSQAVAQRTNDFPDAGSMPIQHVCWEDAQALTRKLNQRVPGGGFRLPTEAEWEFAARAGGETEEAFEQKAPRAVEQGSPNRLGFFDLAGNVREWCSSLLVPYPYYPADGREAPDGPGLRVLRGSAFSEMPGWYDPAERHGERATRRLRGNGLRLARDIPPLLVADRQPGSQTD